MINFIEDENVPSIIACCGSGGVGKTTIAATIALKAALSGKKTIVLTIDPAKRLADSLAVSSVSYEPKKIPPEKFINAGLTNNGELFAMMLDTKSSFDQVIQRYASRQMCQKILSNRYYQHISTTLAGSHEYMAMEKLYEIYHQNIYDLIVLDTPPSRRALDFLEAPQRMANVLGHSFFFKLFRPYLKASKVSLKIITALASPIFKVVRQIMGENIIDDIGEFVRLWDDVLFEGFRQRANAVKNLLSSDESLFIAITSPMTFPMQEAVFLYKKLQEYQIPFGGFIVNRVQPMYDNDLTAKTVQIENKEISDALKDKLIKNLENCRNLGISDQHSIDILKSQIDSDSKIHQIPYLDDDVYDFRGLLQVSRYLFHNSDS